MLQHRHNTEGDNDDFPVPAVPETIIRSGGGPAIVLLNGSVDLCLVIWKGLL